MANFGLKQSKLGKKVKELNSNLTEVYETSKLLNSPMGLDQVLEIVVRTITNSLGLDAAGLRLLDEETGRLELKATYQLSDRYINKGPVTASESELNIRALNGDPIIVRNMQTDPNFAKHRAKVIKEGIVSSLSIGLIYHGKGIGILRLYSKKERNFPEAMIKLAQTIASQSAAAIVNARLYNDALEGDRISRQMKLAGTVQRQLLPANPPQFENLQTGGAYAPCYDIGGDFYDFMTIADQSKLLFFVGDIMGKGIPASLAMASIRAFIRAYGEMELPLTQLVQKVNRSVHHDTLEGEFATAFFGLYDLNSNQLEYCSCGHEPALLWQDGKITRLEAGGMVLGITRDYDCQTEVITMNPGDFLSVFTDGLNDARNFQGESFGPARIRQAIADSARLTARQAANNMIWIMRKYTGLTPRFDDTAIVTLKRV
ncbi:MAG: SpoIIE family protein phosphatase [Sedimentisphaerales bacterium]|nr:SpoIIE family protein phosphatase [Sedimentisphaerales bacterium]